MPAILIRRLVLTGLFLTTFVAAGALFGHIRVAPILNAGDNMLNVAEKSVNTDDLAISVPAPKARGNAGLSWPFFSFRKGGR